MIKFNDLSFWLKISIVMGWITLVIYGFSFLIGFIQGLMGI